MPATKLNDHPDLAIIGAGAAGLAAARIATGMGLSVTVLEAHDHIGGRAVTDRQTLGVPWDRGAHWLHQSDENFFVSYAKKAGFAFDSRPYYGYLWDGDAWADERVEDACEAYFDRAAEAISAAGDRGKDISAGSVVPPDPKFRAMFESWYAAVSGVEPDRTSTLDDARYDDDAPNLRVHPGFGALLAHYGRDVPVALSTPVSRVRWDGPDIAVETARGTVNCRALIVTASTSALAGGAVRFDPSLPPETMDAIHAVPLGEAEKVAFAVKGGALLDFPPNSHIRHTHDTDEAIRFHVRSLGQPVVIGYIAGRFAAALEGAGSQAMMAFAEQKLVEIFGTGILRDLGDRATTHWLGDPFIRGGYSCALPGKADMRAVFGAPVGGRIFFAGEACNAHAYGTVHGAHETGVAAAKKAASIIGRQSESATSR